MKNIHLLPTEKLKQETLEKAAEIDLTNLCYYDKRNPDSSADDEDIEDHKRSLLKKNKTCSCDNCFYGRSKLTEQLISQVKRMYSESEVINILYNFHKEENSRVVFSLHGITKWFEQFKKK
jgi:hypothetical protein